MNYFLEKTARYIIDNYPEKIGSLCIVLPNKRGSLYLRKYIRELLGKTSLTPSYLSISDLVQFLSGYTIIDPVQQLFFFYGVYKEVTQDEPDDLETFMDWAPLVLSDFNDIDLYLADASEVFGYLSEARAIDLWNPGKTELTPLQLKYLRFYRSLDDLYKNLNKQLRNSGLAYEGMAYRRIAETIDTISRNLPWSKIIFAGFNAFSKSEEIITAYLQKNGLADMLWDTDEWYLNNEMQEAGYFIRKHLQHFQNKELLWNESLLKNLDRQINILGLPGNTAQAKMAGSIIDEWIRDGRDLNKSALILADEQLLLPVLNSLPESAGSFNVTMGYPFRFTPVFTFFDNWLKMLDNSEKYAVSKPDGNNLLYKNDLLNVLQHPYFPLISKVSNIPDLIAAIIKSNNFFFRGFHLSTIASNDPAVQEFLQEAVFKIPESITKLIVTIRNLCTQILDALNSDLNNGDRSANKAIDLEYIFHFTVMLAHIDEYWDIAGHDSNLHTFRKVLQKMANRTAIPFFGEPLKGLQVMGFLETRTLDFDNIIILSMNEGIYPDSKPGNTFVSSDIRQIFGLPGNKEKTSIFAYHFYRLLQRAQNVTITYLTEPDLLGGGSKSRFLEQILLELKGNSNTHIRHSVTEFPIDGLNQETIISIEKSGIIIDQLHSLGEKGISPSALSTYIRCPLRFYYQYVLRIEDRIEGTESMDAALLGTLVHDTLYRLYYPLQGKILNSVNTSFSS
ncbi:MAG: PD-(D/E)XK nuclease family protein, partial [Bacteroidetes bacterium]|nr:PD-(D/E)XK nuclease family protein [Bacteroidota bacterium]